MRLLERKDNGEFSLTQDLVENIPAYAILSHTWGDDNQEVTFKDLNEGSGKFKVGYQKIRFCGEQAALDGYRYIWVDTCCIDKSSNAELSEALNSMYRWYQNATKCYVYFADISVNSQNTTKQPAHFSDEAFRKSRWFTRGWTLQELIAPQSVEFFSVEGKLLGDKKSLEQQIHEITGIPVLALQGTPLSEFSVEERFSWAAKRETKKEEDSAYSLLGIFGVFLPLIYGEGREHAFQRLRKEVDNFPKSSVENQPRFTVPFVRDPKFVGRDDIIQEITNQLETQRRIALCGIGGIGKTQIAIEYCYVWKDRYPDRNVFWVHTSTLDGFEQAYRDIAKEMQVPGTEDPQNDTLTIVRDWLSKPENGSWLLILDNADDLALFFELDPSVKSHGRPHISTFLPQNTKGSMIITTRDKRIGLRLISQEVIGVNPLAPLHAGQLLRSKISKRNNANSEEIHGLVEILGCVPLAITQAAAFIQENGIAVEEYFERLKVSDSDLQDYLEEDLPDPRRYPDNENSVIRTWKLSFDQIARQRPRAAEMLSLMVLLDRQAIPKMILKQENERNVEFDKAIGTLQAYSLIKMEKGGSVFEIHRLVQLSTQRWLSLQGKQAEWQENALVLMARQFPSGDYETWEQCESLYLHAKTVTRYKYSPKTVILQHAILHENIASYDEGQGRFEAACLHYKHAMQLREDNLGKKHPHTLMAMSKLAVVLSRQGKYSEAEALNRQTLTLSEEVLRKKHPDTIATMGNLASVLEQQGKYGEAETLGHQTLELSEEVLGKKHPNTVATMGNLALLLERQGKYGEAEALNCQTLEISEEVFGKKHPSTLTTMSNLAIVLKRQGKLSKAETLNRQTLELREEVLGKKHPDTVTTMGNLAIVLETQGKYSEAEILNRQTLTLREEVNGKAHPDTITSVYCLAYLLQNMKEYNEASAYYERACAGYASSLGSEHPTTIACFEHYFSLLDILQEES